MARYRIQGLVRTARRAQEALRDGVAPAERGPFLAWVRDAVRWADEFLREEGVDERSFAAPSRNALAVLRRVAALSPSSLPEPDPSRPVRGALRLRNAVALLEGILGGLDDGRADAGRLDRLQEGARRRAASIAEVCAASGATPASLPARSRSAWALLRWLSERPNLERYAAGVALAVRALEAEAEVAGGGEPCEARARFVATRRLFTIRRRGARFEWRLSLGFLAAGEDDFAAAAARALRRSRVPPEALRRLHALADSEDFGSVPIEVEALADPRPFRPRGRVRDLDALFERLDARFFRGSLPRPRLHWAPTLSVRCFGFFVASRDLVCLNPALDDAAVPEEVAEFVLYHELLHKKHGTTHAGGRRHAHTPEFRAEERLHPAWARARAWLAGAAASAHAPARAAALPPPAPAGPGPGDPCWCGSGLRYGRCHLAADEAGGG
jgi:hypothetical protein